MFKDKDQILKVNQELNKMQAEWYKNVAEKVYSVNKDLSLPFYSGLSENAAGKKIIMIVGQEARKHGHYTDREDRKTNKWTVGTEEYDWAEDTCISSKWSQVVTDIQLHKENQLYKEYFYDENYAGNKGKKIGALNSPFWRFVNIFCDGNFYPFWTNLDKVHLYKGEKTISLTAELEEKFNAKFKYGNEEKSVLLHEIDIIEPDAIVFVTGKNYYKSMACALDCKEIKENKPSYSTKNKDNKNIVIVLTDILKGKFGKTIPAFWTYHPCYLNYMGKLTFVKTEYFSN